MTVIFMEHCFQILEKNKILGVKKILCRPAPYQQWRKGAFFWYVRFVGSDSTNFSPTRIFQLFKFFFILKEILSFSKIWKFGQFKTKTIPAFPS